MYFRRVVLIVLCLFFLCATTVVGAGACAPEPPPFTWDEGAIIRGDLSRKQLALVFTGSEYGEGTEFILDTLNRLDISAGFFVTGSILRQPGHRQLLQRALREGHYVGPHSDQHLLYCSWKDRQQSLVTESQFKADLQKNIDDLKQLGAFSREPVYFIPAYEWFNHEQVKWAKDMCVRVFNFSPGSGSNRDYLPEGDSRFVSSQRIFQGILDYEQKDPHGLNGYILLLHLGADRKDKMFFLLEPLINAIRGRGYQFVRIDRMLQG